MGSFLGTLGWTLWLFVFLFPFGIFFLVRMSGGSNAGWSSLFALLFFYGVALAIALCAFFLAQRTFRARPFTLEERKRILKLIFLVPLVPGIVYILFVLVGLMRGT